MKLDQEALTAWDELKDSFDNLKRMMEQGGSLALMSDQLSTAKVVEADVEALIFRLRAAKSRT